MLFGLLLLPDWNIERFVPFAAFPAAFSSFILLEKVGADACSRIDSYIHHLYTHVQARKKMFVMVLLLFVTSLSAIVMILRFERNYYFGELCHPSELSSLSFFFNYDKNSTVNIVSWRTAMYTPYFEYSASHQILFLWYLQLNEFKGNKSMILFSESLLVNQSQFVIRGMRDLFTLSAGGRYPLNETMLVDIDNEMIASNFNQIYSNGYYSIYRRAIFP